MTSASPRPLLGAYPQSLLCDHLGSAPQSAKIKTTIKIVPSMVCSFSMYSGAVQPHSKPHRGFQFEMLIASPTPG